ncbi:MAG: 2-amino-4-hydroxy-6-hydroxymethyldihydropteridine diphosphokinase [Proteobacteria bacterium]|nr:MAG: 2-amino-4-hydroxy-6-hydroxymethyldihydropteridine diphosphokinase [Pseudomonadota bacterium]
MRYYLSLGSNLNRRAHLTCAIRFLQASFGHVTCSPVYQSPAYGFVGPDFYNMVVAFDSVFTPLALKKWLRQLEYACGRSQQQSRFSNRYLDMDILLAGDGVLKHNKLRLPRPELTKRAYVLKPLFDLASELTHPESGQTMAEIWRQLDASESATITLVDSRDWFN